MPFYLDIHKHIEGLTTKEIAEKVAKEAGDLAKQMDVAANCRARLVAFSRRGWRVEKDAEKRVKVVQA